MSGRPIKPLEWYRETYIRDGYRCVYCGRDLTERFDDWMSIEVDHIIPVSKGGNDNLENRVTTCSVCNRLKGIYLPEDYQSLKRDQMLENIRQHILNKREEWKDRYDLAMKEFQASAGLNKDS